jgi:hypothetical protein
MALFRSLLAKDPCDVIRGDGGHSAGNGATVTRHGARWCAPYPPAAQRAGASFSLRRRARTASG